MSRNLTDKQKAFVEAYLGTLNATEAARRAKYRGSDQSLSVIGFENLRKPKIREEIDKRLKEKAMNADEVLARLGDMARADMGDFLDIERMSFGISLWKAKKLGLTHLIKKVKQRTTITLKKDGDEEETHWLEIELHDSQAALVHLGRYFALFTDRLKVEDWRSEIIELLKSGKIKPEQVEEELGGALAAELFESVGVSIAATGKKK